MGKLELILLDEDLDYAQSVREYVRAREDEGAVVLKVFTKLAPALEAVRLSQGNGVLLAVDRLWPAEEQVAVPVVLLLESLTDTGRLPSGVHFAFKYLPLDQLLQTAKRALAAAANQVSEGKASSGGGKCRVVSWFSAGGGCGKSTAAYNTAVQLAHHGEEVCLVSLESLPSALWQNNEPSARMAEWLYYARSKPQAATERVSELIRTSSHRHLHIVEPFAHPDDAAEMNAGDAELLLDSLRRLQRFTWIVVDLDAGWSARNRGALEGSDRIQWIVTDDAGCLSKTAGLLTLWRSEGLAQRWAERTSFIAGKYVGLTPSGYDRIGLEPSGVLPYVPQWKMVKQPEELLKAAFYSQTLWEMFHPSAPSEERRNLAWSQP